MSSRSATWLPFYVDIWRHKKIYRLMHKLSTSRDESVLLLLKLWSWAIDNAEDGEVGFLTPPSIAHICEWDGDPGALVKALTEAEWLDPEPDGGLTIHEWTQYAGRLVEYRRKDRERKAVATRRDATPTERQTSPGLPRDIHGNSVGTPSELQPTSTRNRNRNRNSETDTYIGTGIAVVDLRTRALRASLPSETRDDVDAALKMLPTISDDAEGLQQLITIVEHYPHIDHEWEAGKCRNHYRRSTNWALTYANWIAGGKGVRYKSGMQGPPYRDDPGAAREDTNHEPRPEELMRVQSGQLVTLMLFLRQTDPATTWETLIDDLVAQHHAGARERAHLQSTIPEAQEALDRHRRANTG